MNVNNISNEKLFSGVNEWKLLLRNRESLGIVEMPLRVGVLAEQPWGTKFKFLAPVFLKRNKYKIQNQETAMALGACKASIIEDGVSIPQAHMPLEQLYIQ